MPDAGAELIVACTASYQGAVGFADVFDCEITRVLAGTIDEPRIHLAIAANDKEKSEFIAAHLRPAEIEIGFSMHQHDEPYDLPLVSGFVDRKKTSWRVEFIREAKT